nr:response regulator [Thiothrix caldifontis]
MIALTANTLASDRAQCLQAGMNDFLSKPFDTQVLLDVLERVAKLN